MISTSKAQNAMAVTRGQHWPLGATADSHGINFAVFSANATAIEVCVFDDSGTTQHTSFFLAHQTKNVWHGYVAGLKPGVVYGLKAYGPWAPHQGHRFNSGEMLLDPYAKDAICNEAGSWRARVIDSSTRSQFKNPRQDASGVIYELHVKGFTKKNPLVPEALRGTFAGLAHPAAVQHLKNLGVTSLSLLPVHLSMDEPRLTQMGLSNYWGYNTLGFFCPNPKLASSNSPAEEFRQMVRTLHSAGISVLLDVVFNHTAESDEHGPTLSFRGLDNQSYYRLPENSLAHYENLAGCGNTLDIRQPNVLQLVTDSLRYWVTEMGVDGFRFDLAPVLGREAGLKNDQFSAQASFFKVVAQDPVLSRVRMIAEPWDIGHNGYQVGNFPDGWSEWNDHFRDSLRRYWLHHGKPNSTRADFATRLCGSSDLFQKQERQPDASINYVVSHDGFTLRDLTSFEQRHNEANGESNRDGHQHNLSVNCGVEGHTSNEQVNAKRAALQRVLLASTLLARGMPMLCAGDEIGHSQNGNNNPYCQDNDITWIDWKKYDDDLKVFTTHAIKLRRDFLPLGQVWNDKQIAWYCPDGTIVQDDAWHDSTNNALGCLTSSPKQNPFFLITNPAHDTIEFTLPEGRWKIELDTSKLRGKPDEIMIVDSKVCLPPSSLWLLHKIS
jgi:glycogen debranching enzyme GlgX